MIQAIATRYKIDEKGEWVEEAKEIFSGDDAAEQAEGWCESQIPKDAIMSWAETQIGMQGSLQDVEYEEWEHVWEIAGWDGEGIEELQYGPEEDE